MRWAPLDVSRLGRRGHQHREGLGFVVGLLVLKAVVELTDELVEQVPLRSGVTISVFSSTAVVLASRSAVISGAECPVPPRGRGSTAGRSPNPPFVRHFVVWMAFFY